MRDVKEAVCRQLPSALLCGKKRGLWTYESEVSSPQYQTYQCYACVTVFSSGGSVAHGGGPSAAAAAHSNITTERQCAHVVA